jgi:PAS domain S-box-containing protein
VKKPLNILLAEDSVDDTELLMAELRRAGFDPKCKRVETETDFLAEMKNSPDIILSDYSMPNFSGLRAAELLRESGLNIPFMLISGAMGEDVAVEAMKRGVTDYLLKDRIARLGAAVEQALEKKRLRDERRRDTVASLETSALLATLLENTTDHIYFKDLQSRFVRFSREMLKHFNLSRPDELKGRTDFDFFTDEHARPAFEDEQEIIRTGRPLLNLEEKTTHVDGRVGWVLTSKMPWRDPAGHIIGTFGISRDITERKLAEDELKWKTAFLEAQVNSSPDGMVVVNQHGKRIFQNQRFTALWKTPPHLADEPDDAQQLRWCAGMVKNPEQFMANMKHLNSHLNEIGRDEIELKDGRFFERYSAPVIGKDGEHYGRIRMIRDITERKKLEAQLIQSQKMETVGKLAGGIAHEFNSILTAIIGQSELLLNDLPAASPLAKNAAEISQAAHRAAHLTRQLLAYGRKQFLQPEALNLNRIVAGMESVLRHLMGGDVDLLTVPAIGLRLVKADAGQIEQVIMNLIINARDAMPKGGKLTLETANVSFDRDTVGRYPELKPGGYVMLAISDTGAGMSDEVKAQLFEPFFTTKDVGQGTGLGLSTCYGIVKQSGGHIGVYSERGRGTTFKIYLPQTEAPAKISVPPPDPPDLPGGKETVLLVEDDSALREMAATLLKRLGYAVLTAANGVEALSVQHERGSGQIDLLFTDVVMPHMSGKELADRVCALYPRMKILFTSAYTGNAIVHQGVLDKSVALLQKPFTPSALAHKLREVLEQRGAPKPDEA